MGYIHGSCPECFDSGTALKWGMGMGIGINEHMSGRTGVINAIERLKYPDDNLGREIEKEAHLTRIEIWAEGEAYGQDSKFYLLTRSSVCDKYRSSKGEALS
ncbi:hypothetical protein PCH_Pc21g16500 [Penicillium rubens Wisconsin 54-1255]|uniref:Uncharacterized protein n=1 Tax=Penicillium rubens (strain ATCC 28089 / DSM 1075 / NRRL 1951 / Wisconsin 54-1255) TaxID=500485 RepID=B6HLC6_PENRW|nr:hypothetical protein PCH_Pc21g16500 [Penicillium rubens Wisconsin 54-1255]